jgi:hypothetical protein
MDMRFSCPRSCRLMEFCKFMPLFRAIGPTAVLSHTVRTAVEYGGNPPALEAAVNAMGGTWLGRASHKLYEKAETGLGFTLPGWRYPLVLKQDGTLAYDDYGGQWGNPADIQTLTGRFAVEAARGAAEAQGWMCEDTPTGLLIYHPAGGTMTVTHEGTVEAFGFEGVGCHAATSAIADAIGRRQEATAKSEFFSERARVSCQE